MTQAMHHLHRRIRVYKKLEPIPHPNPHIRMLDKIIYLVGVVGPFITIPQILKIWSTQEALGVSLWSWVGYLILSIIWTIYGVVHKEKPIIVMNLLNVFMQFLVVLGIIIYL
jgi:MtN3 and saliva related transmembrane protein